MSIIPSYHHEIYGIFLTKNQATKGTEFGL